MPSHGLSSVCIRVIQSWPPLCNPKDCSPPGFSVHGILQPKILEWVVISFSRDSSPPRDWTHVSHSSWIGRQILYHWANWETHSYTLGVSLFIRTQVIWNQGPTLKLVHVIRWQVDKQNIVNIQRNSISTQGKKSLIHTIKGWILKTFWVKETSSSNIPCASIYMKCLE